MRFMQLAEIFNSDRGIHGNSIQQFRNASFRRTADASEDPLKYAIEVFDVTLGKQILAKKPGDFRSGAVLGNFAGELKTGVPVERMLNRAERLGAATSGIG